MNLGGVRAGLWDLFQRVIGGNALKKAAIREQISAPGRILEIGCATGNVADAFRDFEYVGIDIDPALIAYAAWKFPDANYRFHCCDVLEDEFPEPGDFQYVLISHTAHHLSDDYMIRLIRRSAELLRPHGELVVLDMIRPDPAAPPTKQFYHRLDAGKHFRTAPEFVELFADACEFEHPQLRIFKEKKFSIEVIDGILISAVKRAPTR
jgi:SAM-dependent methyltransferase